MGPSFRWGSDIFGGQRASITFAIASSYGMEKRSFVYILASGKHETLYIGMTDDIARRAFEHKSAAVPGFTKKYGVKRLVYYEDYPDRTSAHEREVRMKAWKRDWKIALIEESNPDWDDLYSSLG